MSNSFEEEAAWVFMGNRRYPGFASGVFLSQERAEQWVAHGRLSGTLTYYPIDVSAYEWAVQRRHFRPKKQEHSQIEFIENFACGWWHDHYYEGRGTGEREIADGEASTGSVAPADRTLWLFRGPRYLPGFPSAVVSERTVAEAWITRMGTSGTLMRYPVNLGVYAWAVASGLFVPREQSERSPEFIESFSSVHQEHYHYDRGRLSAA